MRSWRRSTKHTLRYVCDAMLGLGGGKKAKAMRARDGSAGERRALRKLAATHSPAQQPAISNRRRQTTSTD